MDSQTNHINKISEYIRKNPKLVVADDFELSILNRITKTRYYTNGNLKEEKANTQKWMNLRLILRKSPGIATVSGDSIEALQALIEIATKASESSRVDPWFRFPLWRPTVFQALETSQELSEDEKNRAIKSWYSTFSKKPAVFIEEHQVETESITILRKSEKQPVTYSRKGFQSSFQLCLEQKGDWVVEERRANTIEGVQHTDLLTELFGSAIQLAKAKEYTGEIPTRFILGSRVTAFLLQENEEFFLAKTVKSPNPLEENFSEAITIIDDGTIKDRYDSGLLDIEGSLHEKTMIIEKGVFKTLLHNSQTATKENRLSTGNFILRANELTPKLGITNLYIDKGSYQDLLEELKNGLYLDRIERFEKTNEDRYRLLLSGYEITNGRIKEPVRHVPIEISILELLRGARKVAQDLEFFGNTGSPSILFENNP